MLPYCLLAFVVGVGAWSAATVWLRERNGREAARLLARLYAAQAVVSAAMADGSGVTCRRCGAARDEQWSPYCAACRALEARLAAELSD